MTGRSPHDCGVGDRSVSLDILLEKVHKQLGIAVVDRINAQGGAPELRSPELALDRLLAAAHRSVGAAVTSRAARQAHAALTQKNPALEARMAERGPLFNRSSPVRVKYRGEALRLIHDYWPIDLAETMRATIRLVHCLADLLENSAEFVTDAEPVLTGLSERLDEMSRLPTPPHAPVTLTGLDYLVAVQLTLAEPAERLLNDLHRIRHLLDEELAPAISALVVSPTDVYGVDTVAQDLMDDLILGCDQADALARAVVEVERASSDFVGADLSNAKLDGIPLEGILWNATTIWPEEWASVIRRASLPADDEQGVLIIAAQPSSSMLHA